MLGHCASCADAADMGSTQNKAMVTWLLGAGFCGECWAVFLSLCPPPTSSEFYRSVDATTGCFRLFPGFSRCSIGMGDEAVWLLPDHRCGIRDGHAVCVIV